MSNKKRPYLVVDQETGAQQMVIAISQAQAISHIARTMLSATPAAPLDVVAHMQAGGSVVDATAETSSTDGGQQQPAGTGSTPSRDDGEQFDDDDVPTGTGTIGGGEAGDFAAHLSGGIAAHSEQQ